MTLSNTRQVFTSNKNDERLGMPRVQAERIIADFKSDIGLPEIVVHALVSGIVMRRICNSEHYWILRCAYNEYDACDSDYDRNIGVVTDVDTYTDFLKHRQYLRITYQNQSESNVVTAVGTLIIPIRRATDAQEAEGKDMRKLGFDAL